MTVCVAAIHAGGAIFGAADRMLTAGDVEFEPAQPKIRPVTSSIVAMLAGDSAMQAEIIQDLQADVNRRVNAKPEEWLKVRLVAELYNRYYREARARRAERVVLSPIGLDQNTFISRQREMNSDFLRQIAKELYGFEVPGIQTIFAGIDADGPHLYVASGNELSSHDAVGFAAIGAGYWHADSQFMFAGHSRSKQAPETLLLTYAAKKRAEVAPGVGKTLICSG